MIIQEALKKFKYISHPGLKDFVYWCKENDAFMSVGEGDNYFYEKTDILRDDWFGTNKDLDEVPNFGDIYDMIVTNRYNKDFDSLLKTIPVDKRK